MEAKLKEYRALRRRKELLDKTKERLEATKHKIVEFLVPNVFSAQMEKDKKEDEVLLIEDEELPSKETPAQEDTKEPLDITSEVSELESFEEPEPNPESWRYCTMKWTIYTIIWVTTYLFFLKMGFGAVFFVLSALVGIFLNTRTRRKKPGEVSAYSVFNENCESIEGTLKAEELQRQMLYGMAGAVRPI